MILKHLRDQLQQQRLSAVWSGVGPTADSCQRGDLLTNGDHR